MNNDEIRNFIQQAIDENRVMLFMKGTPDQPRAASRCARPRRSTR